MSILDIMNSGLETVIFDPKEMLEILDLRSMGSYKIRARQNTRNLSDYYRNKSVDTLSEQFNRFINTFKEGKKGRNARKISMFRSKQWKKIHVR